MCQYLTGKEKVAKEYKDADGKKVVWYQESYDHHLKIRHFDIRRDQDKITKAIRSPQFRRKKKGCSHYYYFVRENRKRVRFYMEVIVCYNAHPAHVKTAYLTSNMNGATICVR